MKTLKNLLPTGFGIIMGFSAGLATQDLTTGVVFAVIFSLTTKYRQSCINK